jgi:hypothetical protein
MNKKKELPPEELTKAFELGYCAALARLRRDLPPAWRAGALAALTRDTLGLDDNDDNGMRYSSHVRGIKLILMRCESAATMLNWRKELTVAQKEHLRAALDRLQTAASRLR